jgi:hypothetical protein
MATQPTRILDSTRFNERARAIILATSPDQRLYCLSDTLARLRHYGVEGEALRQEWLAVEDRASRSNILPGWRKLHLSALRQHRMLAREGRYYMAGIIKDAQRSAAIARAAWMRTAAQVQA